MELTAQQKQRLEKGAKAAFVAAVAVGLTVKVWRDAERTRYFSYSDNSMTFGLGLLKDGQQKITEVTGTFFDRSANRSEITEEDLDFSFDDQPELSLSSAEVDELADEFESIRFSPLQIMDSDNE